MPKSYLIIRTAFFFCLLFISGNINAQIMTTIEDWHPGNVNGYAKKGVSKLDYKRDTLTQFFDYKWEKSEKIGAYYYSIAYPLGDGWACEDYDVVEKRLSNFIVFRDQELTTLNGPFYIFYANGNAKTTGQYLDNYKEAYWLTYYEDGALKDSTYYQRGIPAGNDYSFYPSGKTERFIQYDSSGRGKYTGYYEDGAIRQTGNYLQGRLKDSIWIYYYPNGKTSFIEEFSVGYPIGVKCFNEDGIANDTCQIIEMPQFTGKTSPTEYLAKNLIWPRGVHFTDTNVAKIVATFVIDKEGNIKDVKIIRHVAPPFDKEVIRVIKGMPRWKPGKKYGQPVETPYTLPITFRETY